jgi:hypothetical protein
MENFDASLSTYFRAWLGPRGKAAFGFAQPPWPSSHALYIATCEYSMRRLWKMLAFSVMRSKLPRVTRG